VIDGGQPPPVQRADQRGDLHRFRVDGGEQLRGVASLAIAD
jgi:hypothetical protein